MESGGVLSMGGQQPGNFSSGGSKNVSRPASTNWSWPWGSKAPPKVSMSVNILSNTSMEAAIKDLLKTKASNENIDLTFESSAKKTIVVFTSFTRFNAGDIKGYLGTLGLPASSNACVLVVFDAVDESEARSLHWNLGSNDNGPRFHGVQASAGRIIQSGFTTSSIAEAVTFIKN